ncbi:hypothetical protein ACFXTH_024191 [Malus domestica]
MGSMPLLTTKTTLSHPQPSSPSPFSRKSQDCGNYKKKEKRRRSMSRLGPTAEFNLPIRDELEWIVTVQSGEWGG